MANTFAHSGFRRPDPGLVGVPDFPVDAPFAARLEAFLPLLDRRATGFRVLFEALAALSGPKLMLETGTLRVCGNWSGDGQSTYMFDHFVQAETASGREAAFFSIDLNAAHVAVARQVCSNATNLIVNDSVFALHTLARQLRGRTVSLLYLDSFDLDHADPVPSARHHMMELAAAAPLLGAGSLVAIDDYAVEGAQDGGKGMFVDLYMQSIDARVIHSGYQKIWRIP